MEPFPSLEPLPVAYLVWLWGFSSILTSHSSQIACLSPQSGLAWPGNESGNCLALWRFRGPANPSSSAFGTGCTLLISPALGLPAVQDCALPGFRQPKLEDKAWTPTSQSPACGGPRRSSHFKVSSWQVPKNLVQRKFKLWLELSAYDINVHKGKTRALDL